jgi:hypothetical protein
MFQFLQCTSPNFQIFAIQPILSRNSHTTHNFIYLKKKLGAQKWLDGQRGWLRFLKKTKFIKNKIKNYRQYGKFGIKLVKLQKLKH